ncbi:MAG: ribosomal protein S18-alanine N-acetyltransferase [Firmicutes bacterium]|nr:ribosomal protein S18-alanine N-acetyltransferase [Bacillota bacterium]
MAELIIRNGVATDADDIAGLEQICFSDPWSKETVLQELTENPRAIYIVAELEGRVIGYVGLWEILDEGHITNVAVSPEYRRLQVGSALIKTMLQVTLQAGIKHHTLEVRAGNAPAQGLYRKFGFVEEGLRKGYYEDNGEDAIIMWRHTA